MNYEKTQKAVKIATKFTEAMDNEELTKQQLRDVINTAYMEIVMTNMSIGLLGQGLMEIIALLESDGKMDDGLRACFNSMLDLMQIRLEESLKNNCSAQEAALLELELRKQENLN